MSDDTRAAQNGTQKREAEFRAGTEQYGPGLLARGLVLQNIHQLNMSKPVAVGRTATEMIGAKGGTRTLTVLPARS